MPHGRPASLLFQEFAERGNGFRVMMAVKLPLWVLRSILLPYQAVSCQNAILPLVWLAAPSPLFSDSKFNLVKPSIDVKAKPLACGREIFRRHTEPSQEGRRGQLVRDRTTRADDDEKTPLLWRDLDSSKL